jgi:hypothetical protein
MPGQRYAMIRVYLSATRLDLAEECAKAKAWLSDAGYEPVDSYLPDSDPVLASCLMDVAGCDLYLLILGYHYGHRPPEDNPENLSITQLEFRHAGERNIPRIVLQPTNIPNVELSDFFHSGDGPSLKAFHEEVGGHVRIGRFASREELIAKLRDGISNELNKLGLAPNRAELRTALQRASRDLLSWPATLPGGDWLDRPELAGLMRRIAESPQSTTLVLGEPGCGKSALLARLGQAAGSQGIPVLGIKADFLPDGLLKPQELAGYLALPVAVVSAVQALAEEGPVLVLVDQLDALADLVVQHSSRLRVLLDLIRDLHGIPNVHVVASCRSFELRHDPSLRNLEAESLTLALPAWESVDAVLKKQGVQAGGWNAELKETLRSPHALATFLSLLGETDEPGLLRSYQGMLEELWKRKVLGDKGERKRLLLDLAEFMAERETLWLPLARFEERFPLVEKLVADGLLSLDDGVGRIGFRHQTFYEFVRARSFVDEDGRLTATVVAKQSSLRIRPQLWHALGYARNVAPEFYQDELRLLWSAPLRPHLRMLIVEFLGRQTAPLPGEIRLAQENFEGAWFQQRFLPAIAGSPGWFAEVAQNRLPVLMAGPIQEAGKALPVLSLAMSFAPEKVLELLDHHWLPRAELDELSWRILGWPTNPPPDVAWVDRLEKLILRMDGTSWMVSHVFGTVSTVLPDQAPRLVTVWLRREWQKSIAADDQGRKSLLSCRDLHDLPAIAEAAPVAFIRAIWPLLLEMLESVSGEAHAFVACYRDGATMWVAADDDLQGDEPLPEAVLLAVDGWAKADPQAFQNFATQNTLVDLLLVQRWLAHGLTHCAATNPAFVLEFLCTDPRRLVLGPYSNIHRDSRKLIEALVPHLDDAGYARLEAAILNWRYYSNPPDDEPQIRLRRLRTNREHRLRLLRALPRERLYPDTRKLVDEEERAFPDLQERDVWFSGMREVVSPVSAEQMAKGSDEDILHLFAELTDEHERDHPRHSMQGGAIQAGRALAQLAQNDTERAVHLLRSLVPGRNEIPAGEVLRDLPKAGYAPERLFALVKELDTKGFDSGLFRRDAAHAVAESIATEHPAPESLLILLESWLVPLDKESDEEDEREERGREGSLLWGMGGFSAPPSGNYLLLEALSKACLVVDPPRMERWLDILEAHLARRESVRVWAALAGHYLRWLKLAPAERAQAFLDELFYRYPAVLGKRDGAFLMAYLQHWIAPDKAHDWLEYMEGAGRCGAQGYGEVLLLRHAIFPVEAWPHSRVTELLSRNDEATLMQRVGIAYAVVELWSEMEHRTLVHGYLLKLLASTEQEVLRATAGIFLKTAWLPDQATRSLLDALTAHPEILRDQRAEFLGERLEPLVGVEPERVARLANVLLDQVGNQMGNVATAWYLSSEPLLAVALALQDMGEPHRTSGVALFERMLEFNLPPVQEAMLSLDKRMPQNVQPSPVRRRRKAKPANATRRG